MPMMWLLSGIMAEDPVGFYKFIFGEVAQVVQFAGNGRFDNVVQLPGIGKSMQRFYISRYVIYVLALCIGLTLCVSSNRSPATAPQAWT